MHDNIGIVVASSLGTICVISIFEGICYYYHKLWAKQKMAELVKKHKEEINEIELKWKKRRENARSELALNFNIDTISKILDIFPEYKE